MHTIRRSLSLAALLMVWSWPAAAQDRPATQPSHQEQVALRDFTTSLMREAIIGECRAKAYAGIERMQTAYAQWRAPREVSIATGQVAALTRYPDLGGSAAAQRSNFRKHFDKTLKPGIEASPEEACSAALSTFASGLPIPFNGDTRTSPELRFDIYKQAIVAGSAASGCTEFDSIDGSVLETAKTDRGVTERWLLKGCGKEVALTVKHQPSANGGSDFVISMAPVAVP
ncbi:hypothetical protein LVB77_00125 [Lysobacter sp. 5GHs7-4]|uniref:hypothetical protein n=1 Tax=Lysobacter sp. 5GHs7-4 TaxID=2904253 RepID=UPI001E32B9E4|nr:hypothetical protein [Lysobacter sp. 5GHs7-4]UHQ23159.1 hypothetical protein LVB77_00125 [Lysobacter sp. 5GHs7-4]